MGVCVVTENGFVRVISQPCHPTGSGRRPAGTGVHNGPHEFWPCDVSPLDTRIVDHSRLHGPRQVTDAYLLALATAHGGHFVTFDRSRSLSSVRGAGNDRLTVP